MSKNVVLTEVEIQEAISALYGSRECLGKIGNIQHAIDILESKVSASQDKKPCPYHHFRAMGMCPICGEKI